MGNYKPISLPRAAANGSTCSTVPGVPCGPIYHMDEMWRDPQVEHLEMSRPVDHPVLGRIECDAPRDEPERYTEDAV